MKFLRNITGRKHVVDDARARELMDKLMEGRSTIDEERQLYAYYRRRNLPSDMEAQREFVEWLSCGLDDNAAKNNHTASHGKMWLRVAAVFIPTAIAVVGTMSIYNGNNPDYSLYAGSYVIENGKRISNIKDIYPQLIETERKIARVQEMMERRLEEMERLEEMIPEPEISPEDSIIKVIAENTTDPNLRLQIIESIKSND